MGIPRLRQLLEPYAEQIDLKGRDIVIDGPGLAYHILHYCQREATSLFDLPSHSLLGQTAIRWLDELSASGAKIVAIYFDGYLPSAKEPERKRRLMDLSKGLRSYYSLYPSGVPKTTKKQVPVSFSTFTGTFGPKKLPTPAFLVPAVLEALCTSETYRPSTKLVPGEADIYCARHVSSSGGVILTSDSDLLVHDLGPQGSVAFFATVEFKTLAGDKTTTVSEYSGSKICERISLPREKGLSSLGFQIILDPQVNLNRAIQLAKAQINSDTVDVEHTIFMQQYLSPETIEHVSLEPISGRLLDPRISELLLGFLSKTEDASVSMYLPFLADSPARTSAWEISTPLRQMAYAAAGFLATEPITGVVEYRRLQSLPGGTRVETVPRSQVRNYCTGLIKDIAMVQGCVAEPELRWLILAIYQDMRWSEEHQKSSILSLDMLQAEANGNLDVGAWDFVHLHAQVQGIHYSLRMLRQVYDFVCRDHELPEEFTVLRTELDQLSVLDIPSIADFVERFAKVRTGVDLQRFFEWTKPGDELSVQMHSILNPKEKKGKGKRKRDKKSAGQQEKKPGNPSRGSNNPFEFLGDG
ncbi:XPG domain containing-domain-containing protein [Coniochaeta sp. 2T2.1]|nr:XPG domain containing-domain-containing protein [Coniochaeta sp. 2T2.1]